MRAAIRLALLGLLVSSPAAASPAWYRWRASMPGCGSFGPCASYTVQSVTTTSGTVYSIIIRNPANVHSVADNFWEFDHPDFTQEVFGFGDFTMTGRVGIVVPESWGPGGTLYPDVWWQQEYFDGGSLHVPDGILWGRYIWGGNTLMASSLVGCGPVDQAIIDEGVGYAKICPKEGYNGSVSVNLYTTLRHGLPDVLVNGFNICNDTQPCTFSASPEPSTWALMAAGLGVIGFGAWRRGRSSHRS